MPGSVEVIDRGASIRCFRLGRFALGTLTGGFLSGFGEGFVERMFDDIIHRFDGNKVQLFANGVGDLWQVFFIFSRDDHIFEVSPVRRQCFFF